MFLVSYNIKATWTEGRDVLGSCQQLVPLGVSAGVMSVRTTNRATAAQLMHAPRDGSDPGGMMAMGAMSEMSLAEGSGMRTSQPNEPLVRTLNVSIRGNLSELASNPSLSIWAPTQEALSSMFQQNKFKNLQGEVVQRGDLKSAILHSISVKAVKSDFPFALGAKITGVDETTFTRTGKAFSTVFMPNETSHNHRVLQKDDVEVAYDFAQRYPG